MPLPPEKFTLKQFWLLLKIVMGSYLSKFVIWTAVIGLIYFHSLVPPFLVGKIVDFLSHLKEGDSWRTLYVLSGLLTFLWIVASIARLHLKQLLSDLCIIAAYRARVLGFERLMSRSVQWHQQESTGNKVQRITIGSVGLQEFLRILHTELLTVTIGFIGSLGSFFIFGTTFGIIGVLYLVGFLSVQTFFFHKVRGELDASKHAAENATGVYVEGATNILTIKTLNLEKPITANVVAREQTARDLKLRINRLIFWKWRCLQLVNGFGMGSFVLFLSRAVILGRLTTGDLVILFTYFRGLIEAAGDSTSFFDSLSENWISVGRMAPLFTDIAGPSPGTALFPTQWSTIELKNVSSLYNAEESGLHDITFTIHKGEHLGIVGSSGAGKSTLAKVLLGVQPLQSGSYLIGNVPFSKISPGEVSDHMSMVLQDSELFNLSLRDNITVMRDVSEERLAQAIQVAHLTSVVALLPEGTESLIGEKGYRLSGGERQRLGLARAICKNADILVLDEATSALDGATESAIHSALNSELGDKTLIIIAHRLSTLKDVDRILVLDGGRVVEEGSLDALLALDDGIFRKMWKDQQQLV